MEPILPIVGLLAAGAGLVVGYYTRQTIAKRRAGSIEQRIQKKVTEAKKESEDILSKAKTEAKKASGTAEKEIDERKQTLVKTEQLLLEREKVFDTRAADFETKEQELRDKVEKLKKIEDNLAKDKEKVLAKLEDIAGKSQEEAYKELIVGVEEQNEKDILMRMRKLEQEGEERYDQRAREIISYAIQKTAVPQAQEITLHQVKFQTPCNYLSYSTAHNYFIHNDLSRHSTGG